MRSHSRSQSLGLLASLALCACAAKQQSMSGTPRAADVVRSQIEQAATRFSEAFNRGDASALAAMYDTAGVVLAPNAPPMHGRQNIEAFWAGAKQQGFKTLSLIVDSVEPIGNHAVELGRYTLVIQPTGQPETTDRGKYMVLWKRQADGSWKLYRDTFNTSMPAR